MREILFRGKRLDNGDWVYGYYVHIGPVSCQRAYIIPEYASSLYVNEVDPSTVGQYTGLKDKNGKKVFEGDIIRKTNKGRHPEIFIANIRTCFYTNEEVYYSPCDHFTESCEYEIIGNIHDNKSLLNNQEAGE